MNSTNSIINYYPVFTNGKWGIKDVKNNRIIPGLDHFETTSILAAAYNGKKLCEVEDYFREVIGTQHDFDHVAY